MKVRPIATLSAADVRLLDAAVHTLDVDEPAGEAMFLRTDRAGRHWLLEGAAGQVTIDLPGGVPGENAHDWLPLPERVRRLAVAAQADEIALSLVDDCTVLAGCGEVSAAIDLVDRVGAPPARRDFVTAASAVVDLPAFRLALWTARCMPSGLRESEYPTPPMWLQFGGGAVGLHVDWEDFLVSRATYRVPARLESGTAIAAIPHGLLAVFLEALQGGDDEEAEVTISVGMAQDEVGNRPALTVEGSGWRLLLWRRDPLMERWADLVMAGIEMAGSVIVDREAHAWILDHGGTEVRVQLHHRSPDVARVSAVVAAPVSETIELLRELSQLNASATYLRFWMDDDAARVAMDLRCTELGSLAPAIREVATAASAYSPMIAAIGVGG